MNPEDKQFNPETLESFMPLLWQMMRVKRPLSSAPTFTPKNFFEQVQLYENGATRRVYIWFGPSSGWRYFTGT